MKNLSKDGLRNTSHILFGNIFSQFITFLAFIYIAVELGRENLGTYSIVIAFVSFFRFLTLPGLDRVHMIEGSKNLEKIPNFLSNNIYIKILACFIAFIFTVIFCYFSNYNSSVKFLIYVFSLSLFLSGIISYCTSIFQSYEKMNYISFFKIINSTSFVLLSVCFLYFGFGLEHLFYSRLISFFLVANLFYFYSQQLATWSIKNSKGFMPEFFSPSIIYTGVAFLATTFHRVDVLMLSFLGSLSEVGLYAIVALILTRIIELRNAIALGFSPTFLKNMKKATYDIKVYLATSFLIIILLSLPCFIFAIFSEQIIIFLFTNEYAETSKLIQYSIFCIPLSFGTIPFTLLMQGTNNENVLFQSNLIKLISQISLNYIFYNSYGLIGISYSALVAYTLSLSFFIFRGFMLFHNKVNSSSNST